MKLSDVQAPEDQGGSDIGAAPKKLKLSDVAKPAAQAPSDLPSWLRDVVSPPAGVKPGNILPFGTTEDGKVARYQEGPGKGLPKLVLPEWISAPVRGAAVGLEAAEGKGPTSVEQFNKQNAGDVAALAGAIGNIRSPAARGAGAEPVSAAQPPVEQVQAEALGPKPQPAPPPQQKRGEGPIIEGEIVGRDGEPPKPPEQQPAPPAGQKALPAPKQAATPNAPVKLSQVQGGKGVANPSQQAFVPPSGWWKPARPVAQSGAAPSVAQTVAGGLRKVFSPQSVSPEAGRAASGIRREIGQAERDTASTAAALKESRAVVAPHLPEFQGYVQAMRGQPQIMPPTKPALLRMINHIEGGPDQVPKDLEPVAASLKDAYQQRRTKLENTKSTQNMSFVDDYFTHLWKNQDRARQLFSSGGGKQGSGLNLKNRYIPTLEDGLAAGLEPISYDPIDMTMAYVTNMDRYIANNRIIDKARAGGDVKYYQQGSQPEGWVPLNGRLAEKRVTYPTRGGSTRQRQLQAYAPADFARVYNNFISRGFYDLGQTAGDLYSAFQRTSNAFTLMELGLSAYHAGTMLMGGVASGLGRAIGRGAEGDIVPGIRKGSVSPPLEEGRKFQEQYLRLADYGPDYRKIADLGSKVNIRVVPREDFYRSSAMGSFFGAWKKGALRAEMASRLQNVKERPLTGAPLELMKAVGTVVDDVSGPIFDHLIPRIKSQAFYDEMNDFLRQNPGASEAQQVAQATKVWDSIDNRFGEMVQDNIFWNKMLKQVSQLVFRSPTWNLGIIRLMGQGTRDLAQSAGRVAKGKTPKLTPNAQYILGAVAAYGLANGAMTYLKTGQAPNDWKDLFSYQTGGQNPDGTPERALVPGHAGEIMGYIHDPVQETMNKVSTFLRLFAYEVPFNKDYRGLPIHEEGPGAANPGILGYLEDMIGHVASSFLPISIRNMSQGAKQGSGLSPAERAFGIRNAPTYFTSPERAEALQNKRNKRLNAAKHRSDQRQQNQ